MFAGLAGGIAAGVAADELRRIIEAAEERRRQQENKERDAFIRDLCDPFEILNELQFREKFRLSKEEANQLCERIQPLLPDEGRTSTIPKRIQILTTLHFYATGSYQQSIAVIKFFCTSQSTVSRIIENVTTAIITELADECIRFPDTVEELERNSAAFQAEALFPGIVGCIDCTHIPIIGPIAESWLYMNYKGYYSMNIQVTCDYKARITSIDGYPGLNHDARIWRESAVKDTMERFKRELPSTYFLLGDSGYPLSEILITPIPEAEEDTPEYQYTRRHTHTRSIVERVFGILKGRFRCLYKLRALAYDPQKAVRIFVACAILHNSNIQYRIQDDNHQPDDINIAEEEPFQYNRADIGQNRGDLLRGRRLRQQIINHYFTQN